MVAGLMDILIFGPVARVQPLNVSYVMSLVTLHLGVSSASTNPFLAWTMMVVFLTVNLLWLIMCTFLKDRLLRLLLILIGTWILVRLIILLENWRRCS
jgi:hypothetical protein